MTLLLKSVQNFYKTPHWPTHVPFASIYIPLPPKKKSCIKPCPPIYPTITQPLTPFTCMKPIFSPHTLPPTIPQSHMQLVKCKGNIEWALVSAYARQGAATILSRSYIWMKQYGQLIGITHKSVEVAGDTLPSALCVSNLVSTWAG